MEKQILKAQSIIKSPSKNTKAKFVKAHNEKLKLNEDLIKKTTKLLGVKGYYTDLVAQELPTNNLSKDIMNFTKLSKRLGLQSPT
jgi:hypothetical protein